MSETNIGDINSSAIGSGARFNAGKPAVELLPLLDLARFYHFRTGEPAMPPPPAIHALYYLGAFQEGGDLTPLLNIINILGCDGGIEESARVFDYGRGKYAAWNWAKGMPWSVPIACAARHLKAMIEHGDDALDSESGRLHRGHVLCNIWMLVVYARTYTQGDDRPPRELFPDQSFRYGVDAPPPKPAPGVWPVIERRAPRPKDAELMEEAVKALNDFGVSHRSPDQCFDLKRRLRAAAHEGQQ